MDKLRKNTNIKGFPLTQIVPANSKILYCSFKCLSETRMDFRGTG